MAFPTNGILDDFNRADQSPATGWSIAYSTAANIRVTSNQAHSANTPNSFAYAYWNAGTFSSDQEAYFTMAAAPGTATVESCGLLLRWGSPNTGSEDGYSVRINVSAIRVDRVDNGVFTPLGSDISKVPANGDALGATITGSTIEVWYKASGGSWTSLGTRTDSTYTGAGYIGVRTDRSSTNIVRLDDFGGGALAVPPDPSFEVTSFRPYVFAPGLAR